MSDDKKTIMAWRKILFALENAGLDFFLQEEIDIVVEAIKKSMEKE